MIKLHVGEIVTLIYESKEKEITKRSVRVLAIRETRILAYCYLRKRIRNFDLANILALFPAAKRSVS